MKTLKLLSGLLFLALALYSCGDYLNGIDLPSGSNLPGTWQVTKMTQDAYSDGTLEDSQVTEDLGTMTFNKGGDGNYSFTSEEETSSGTFDWVEANDKVYINLLSFSDSIWTENVALAFDVETNTSTEQVWTASFSYYTTEDNGWGVMVKSLKKTELKMEMEKEE
jgi:hypothetical protein